MALLERGLKQRIVGALVLIALAVIFLPMLFTREDESRQVVVEAPPRPQSPAMPSVEVQPTEVPELQPGEEGIAPREIVEEGSPAAAGQPSQPIGGLPATPPATQRPPRPRRRPPACRQASRNRPLRRRARRPRRSAWTPTTCRRAGRYSLPACPTGRAPRNLQKTLRSQGYNAYIRSFDGMNRVFVGPVIQRAEADRLRDQLSKQQKLNGFVVRFQPERG
ncbi:DedD protein [Pseudomonas aeruginosa]|nr:DedD protein [Pseudomonas aeruginosa]